MVDQQQAIVVENNLQNVDNILLLFKGKTRTKRPRSPSSPLPFTTTMSTTTTSASADDSEAAVSTEEKQEEEDMARCLILLAQGSNQLINTNNNKVNNGITSSLYECKTCNRSFPSFQALGGHRASHKKPKLLNNDRDNVCLTLQMSNNSTTSSTSTHNTNTTSIYTNTNSNNNNIHNNNNNNNNNHVITKVMKVHECGTCGAEFSSGQALGGHMRRHRPIGAAVKAVSPVEKTVVVAAAARSNVMTLDLNLPAPEEEQMQRHFVFPSNDKTLVFTASSLVDCHY